MKPILILLALIATVPTAVYAETVPSVGCSSEGQTGPQPAPRRVSIEAPGVGRDAAQLADYVMADGTRTLAPRGWRCGGLYGSDGSVLFVAPDAAILQALLKHRPVSGPAVIRRVVIGDTSGRFEAARIAAMLFPAASRFVAQVEAEKLESPFPRGLPRGDRLTRLTPFAALYTTPAGMRGIGTSGAFAPGALPVDGMAALSSDGSFTLEQMNARLAPAMRPLVADIIKDMKRELSLTGRRR